MHAVISSLFVDTNLGLIKFAALYADTITIPRSRGACITETPDNRPPDLAPDRHTGVITDVYSTFPQTIEAQLSSLLSEPFVRVHDVPSDTVAEFDFFDLFTAKKEDLLEPHPEGGYYCKFDEMDAVALGYSPCYDGFDISRTGSDRFDTLRYFFGHQAYATFAASLRTGGVPLTDSQVVQTLLTKRADSLSSIGGTATQRTASVAQTLVNEYLPGVADAPFDQILEVRRRCGDELAGFHAAVAILASKIATHPWEAAFASEVDRLVETDVRASVHQLRMKLKSLKGKFVQRMFVDLQNPGAYVPLLGGVVAGLPPAVALAASVGVVALKSVSEAWLENSALRRENGLTFLVDPPGIASRWRPSG